MSFDCVQFWIEDHPEVLAFGGSAVIFCFPLVFYALHIDSTLLSLSLMNVLRAFDYIFFVTGAVLFIIDERKGTENF